MLERMPLIILAKEKTVYKVMANHSENREITS